ncbi:MAG: PA14 domain-containing protein [Chromatiaceae bacterium]
MVVVNAASPLSQHIANEYMELREVPDANLLRLDKVPSVGTLPINEFRRKIWQPIQDYMQEHRMEQTIDLIAYSADFPYGVDFRSDAKAHKLPRNRYRGHVASLTGLTFFAHRVMAEDVGYLDFNHYFNEFAGPARVPSGRGGRTARLGKQEVKRLKKEAARALKKRDYPQALESYRKLVDDQPGLAEHWYQLARVESAAGRVEEALASLKEAVELGWANSLRTRRDRELSLLHVRPEFQALLRRMETAFGPFEITHGFRHRYVWSNSDLAFWETDDRLDQYYLSTFLAYTGVRGNSMPEISHYLSRAAASDGTAPDGTVYLLENRNVRSDTRQPLFPVTVAELSRRGRKASILASGDQGQDGILPVGRDDVMGAVVGAQGFNWEKSQSRLLPGAIAESLTSFGGHFDKASQTKLTAFLRHGAAGSSGAVAEPFAFQEKFPVPMLHAYYADGSSLAEAYYQSIQIPYQLIIVGDPLARPFAQFARVGLKAPDPAGPWSGVVRIVPELQPAQDTAIETVELWVDGQYSASVTAGEPIVWDSRQVEDGSHELRLVAIEKGPIETRSVFRTTIAVFNDVNRFETIAAPRAVDYEQSIAVSGHAIGAQAVELRRGHQLLASADTDDGHWDLTVPAKVLGMGEASVFVRAVFDDGQAVRSVPLPITINPPARLPADDAPQPEAPGLLALVEDAQGRVFELPVDRLDGRLKTVDRKAQQIARIQLSGYLKVDESGTYQLTLRTEGRLKLWLHDELLLDQRVKPGDAEAFVAVGLEPGWHPVRIELKPSGRNATLRAVLAGQTTPVLLSAANLAHDAAVVSD